MYFKDNLITITILVIAVWVMPATSKVDLLTDGRGIV